MSPLGRLLVALALATPCAACDDPERGTVPEQTGNGDPTDPGDQVKVDETGFLVGSLFHYTAATPLGAEPTEVTVVGLPGAIASPGGTLTADNTTSGAAATLVVITNDKFVVKIPAAAGDVLALGYTLDGTTATATLTLSDALDSLPAPTLGTGSGTSQPALELVADDAGFVTVSLGDLVVSAPALLVFNAQRGDAVLTSPFAASVDVAGQSGDTVCLCEVDPEPALAGPTLCEDVP